MENDEEMFVIGLAMRPSFRMACFQRRLQWEEQKGFLQSAFRVWGNHQGVQELRDFAQHLYEKEADRKAAEILKQIEQKRRREARWYSRFYRWIKGKLS